MSAPTTPETTTPVPVSFQKLGGKSALVLDSSEAPGLEIEDGQTYRVYAENGEIRLVGPVAPAAVSE